MKARTTLSRLFVLTGVLAMLSSMLLAQGAPPPAKKKAAAKPAPADNRPALEPKAMEILKAMGDKLASANTLQFSAVEMFEQMSRQGVPLAYATRYKVDLQRPDKLRVITPGDGPPSDFYYNGKTIQAYAPVENLVAVADAPATTEGALEQAYKTAGIYFPFTDFILGNPYQDALPGLKHAYYIGQSKIIGGTTTDLVAFASSGVFAQIWIGVDDHLPRMIRAIYVNDPEMLRHEMAFADWKLDESLPADTFTLPASAASAKRIPFAHPAGPSAASDKPPQTKKPASKTQ